MDIKSLNTKKAAELSHRFELVNPVDGSVLEHEGKPMIAVVVSTNSKEYETALSRIVSASRKSDKYGEQEFSFSAERMKKANLAAACTKRLCFFEKEAWVDVSNDGTSANHKAIRTALLEYGWMLDQLDDEIGKQSNFLGKSETISSSI